MIRLQHSFPSRERFVRTFVRRLSATGMEVELTAQPGSLVDLDLRLEDGAPLVVGLGEVGSTGTAGDGWQRIRFVELEEGSRGELGGLVALGEAVAPAPPRVDTRDPDETLESLVAGVFGGPERRPSADDTIMVPPEPAVEPPPAEEPPAARAAPEPEPPELPASREEPPEPAKPPPARQETRRRRPSLLQRLQVSPAVIVASIIAGATGAAADAWFEELAAFVSELVTSHEELTPPAADLMPAGLTSSRFPEAEVDPPQAEPAEPAAESLAGEPAPAPGAGLPRASDEVPAAAESAPGEVAPEPADRVRVITWDESARGTVVTFWGNGSFPAERVVRFRIAGGKPRELVKLRGIDVPFPQAILELGTPEVERIRTGFHPKDRVNELHVVLDLTGSDVVIDRVEPGPENLRVHLHRGGDAPPSGTSGS